ncbi:hypothetical protein [Microcoleus sp. FACHB-672]|uniref:hypothetical protein n=1 Tax=Microcoleus sp. FACHB-672 TaxID=2692825 RepID=UPI0018EFEAA7|nr:hypothetical protein [Microcoleus sp. FACHB-672]
MAMHPLNRLHYDLPMTDQGCDLAGSPKIRRLMRFSVRQLVIAGLLAMAVPQHPAAATHGNNYQSCASKLLNVGLFPETVAPACAGALDPEELASCVVKIYGRTDIAATDALTTCRQVRRPRELATCVVDISKTAQASLTPVVLDNCRRSLLPKRYSECVVGLSRNIDVVPAQAMTVCIDAADRIADFDPSFIPQNQLPGTPAPTPN